MSDPISKLKQELVTAAERQQTQAVVVGSRSRSRALSDRNRLLPVAAALSIAAAAALLLSAPWKNTPGFLERAHAALTAPTESIVHYQWETEIPAEAGCASLSGEIWIDQVPPHAYRAFLTDCVGERHEIGGVVGKLRVIQFEAPDRLVVPDLFVSFPANPVTELRAAIREDRAHDEGTTQLDGRTVERIRMDCTQPAQSTEEGAPPPAPCPQAAIYMYVDPQTYFPVQAFFPDGFGDVGSGQRWDIVQRFNGFEYLPRSPANLALTDIRAQHPDATGP